MRGQSLPSARWKAHERWHSVSYMVNLLQPLHGVWQQLSDSRKNDEFARSFVYFAERGENNVRGAFGMRAPPASSSRVIEHERLAAVEFFAMAQRGAILYCSHDLAALGDAAVADVTPLAALDLRNSSTARGIVWLGAGRPVTHGHYDTSHNVFVQVVGRKRFTLWPPAAHSRLHLYPTRHSLHRQSSLRRPPLDAPSGSASLILEEGDALYVPPFYAHHVEALSNLSISVARWSPSEAEARKDALETLPLPWEAEWSVPHTVLAAALFVRAVLSEMHDGDAARARSLLQRHLRSRFEPLRALPLAEQEGLLSPPGSPLAERLRSHCAPLAETGGEDEERVEHLRQHVADGARRVAAAARNVSTDWGVIELVLGNYVEAVTEFVAGRESTHAFLTLCVCGDESQSWRA